MSRLSTSRAAYKMAKPSGQAKAAAKVADSKSELKAPVEPKDQNEAAKAEKPKTQPNSDLKKFHKFKRG